MLIVILQLKLKAFVKDTFPNKKSWTEEDLRAELKKELYKVPEDRLDSVVKMVSTHKLFISVLGNILL